jgi:hypothetical protein
VGSSTLMIWIFLAMMITDIEHLFKYLLGTYMPSLEDVYIFHFSDKLH